MHFTTTALLAIAPFLTLAQEQVTFTRYGTGDPNNSGNCNVSNNACGFAAGMYSAALSEAAFGVGPNQGAGPACGSCWSLTITSDGNGGSVPQNTITVKVDNLCPADTNELCQAPNKFGVYKHFDLCNDTGAPDAFFANGAGFGMGTATQVSC